MEEEQLRQKLLDEFRKTDDITLLCDMADHFYEQLLKRLPKQDLQALVDGSKHYWNFR